MALLSNLLKDRTKPSEYIRHHLNGTGNGFELDDLVSWHDGDPEWQDVIDRLMEISRHHGVPLGVYKEEARDGLHQLAEELEAQGR